MSLLQSYRVMHYIRGGRAFSGLFPTENVSEGGREEGARPLHVTGVFGTAEGKQGESLA